SPLSAVPAPQSTAPAQPEVRAAVQPTPGEKRPQPIPLSAMVGSLSSVARKSADALFADLAGAPEQAPIPLHRTVEEPASLQPHASFCDLASGTSASGTIVGRVFADLNGDGVQDCQETGLEGQTVYLDLNRNGVWDEGEPATVTDANGDYCFTGLELR